MNKLNVLLLAMMAAVLWAGASLGAGTETAMKAPGPAASPAYNGQQLIGLNVFDKAGGAIGYIKGVNVDGNTGNIGFAIVAKGNMTGGELAVPPDVLAIHGGTGKATLLIPANTLAKVGTSRAQVSCADVQRVWDSINN